MKLLRQINVIPRNSLKPERELLEDFRMNNEFVLVDEEGFVVPLESIAPGIFLQVRRLRKRSKDTTIKSLARRVTSREWWGLI